MSVECGGVSRISRCSQYYRTSDGCVNHGRSVVRRTVLRTRLKVPYRGLGVIVRGEEMTRSIARSQ